MKWAVTNGGLVPMLEEKVAGVSSATKCLLVQSNFVFEIRDQLFSIPHGTGFYADANFLDILDFPLIHGIDSTALKEPNTIVLTETAALRFFNTTDVLGETVVFKYANENINLAVTGVLKDVPENCHMQFDYLLSFKTLPQWDRYSHPQEGGFPVYVYFKTETEMPDSILQRNVDRETRLLYSETMKFPVQKVIDIHFNATSLFEHAKTGNIVLVSILGVVAIFILVIAIINYIILSTSQSMRRTREVAIRKTLGSASANLVVQFLTESLLLCLISCCVAFIMVEAVLRLVFPNLFQVNLSLFDSVANVVMLVALCVLAGLLSGLFPAYQVSGFKVTHMLKGQSVLGKMKRFSLRTVLITLQFVFTISVMTGALVVMRQLFYLKNKDLGFEKELTINVSRSPDVSNAEWNFFKEALRSESSVQSIGTTLYKFIGDYNAASLYVIDEAKLDTLPLRVQWNAIDENLIPTLKMEMVEGRNFSAAIASDAQAIILNEAARRQLGLDTLYSKKVMTWFFGGARGTVIGVVKNYHFQSFEKEVMPIALILHTKGSPTEANLLIRLQTRDFANTLSVVKAHWKESGIEAPLEFSFLDDWVGNLIRKEEQLSQLIVAFALLCVAICILGVVGLVNFTAAQKQKEMGIRRVFGATVQNLVLDMNRYFLPLFITAFVIAIPLSTWGIRQWLTNFVYRVDILYADYLIIFAIFLLFVISAISIQSFKFAAQNPTNTLGQE